jgi:hypothetical protein
MNSQSHRTADFAGGPNWSRIHRRFVVTFASEKSWLVEMRDLGLPTLLAQGTQLTKMLRMFPPTTSGNLLFEIAKDVFLAGLAAWLTVKRALREFSSQRWWERQEEAYRKIIDSLSQIQVSLARMSNMGPAFVSIDDQLQH